MMVPSSCYFTCDRNSKPWMQCLILDSLSGEDRLEPGLGQFSINFFKIGQRTTHKGGQKDEKCDASPHSPHSPKRLKEYNWTGRINTICDGPVLLILTFSDESLLVVVVKLYQS